MSGFSRLWTSEGLVRPSQRLGPLPKTKAAYGDVLQIALPAVAEMVLISLITSADTIMVGQLGKNALAAVSLPGQPRMIMLSLFFALNVGVTAIVARRKGEDRPQEANRTLRNAILFSAALSVVVMALTIAFAEPLMRLSGGNTNTPDDAEVLSQSVDYFVIMIWALPVNAISMAINAALRGVGDTKLTMKVNVVSNLVNVFFNYLLIYGHFGFPALGVRGAAIASVIGMCAGSMLSVLAVVHSGSGYLKISRHDDWRPDRHTMGAILRIGGNAMVEQISVRIGFFLYSRIIYSLGVTLFAAHNICMQFLGLTFNFADGLAVAGTSLVGQNMGAGRPDLSHLYGKISQRIALLLSLAIGLMTATLRYPLTLVFINPQTPDAASVIAAAAQTMLVVALMQPLQMSAVVMAGCLRGAGDNLFVASRMAICVTVLRPLLTAVAVYALHADLPLTWLLGLSEIGLRLYFFYTRFESGKWRARVV